MAGSLTETDFRSAISRVAGQAASWADELNQLDAATGDGDLGITMARGAAALEAHLAAQAPAGDVGALLIGLGMAFNRAAPSTMGTLIATALMRAGKEARGLAAVDGPLLARMLSAADAGIQERGKAQPGDKTVVDALHPAAEAFAAAIEQGSGVHAAAQALLAAARAGRDAVIPLRSKMGRAAWVGERTENLPDAGTVLLVRVFEAGLRESAG